MLILLLLERLVLCLIESLGLISYNLFRVFPNVEGNKEIPLEIKEYWTAMLLSSRMTINAGPWNSKDAMEHVNNKEIKENGNKSLFFFFLFRIIKKVKYLEHTR